MSRYSEHTVWDDKDTVVSAFSGSESGTDVFRKLNLPANSSNYRKLKKYALKYNLTIPKLSTTRMGNTKFNPRIPLSEILVENSSYSNRTELKRRLVREMCWEFICMVEGCPSPEPMWAGKPLVLRLDHINGVGDDNRIENLRFICPNCDSQSDTFCGRNPHKYPNGVHGLCGGVWIEVKIR